MRYCLELLHYQIVPRQVERSFVTCSYPEWLFLDERGDIQRVCARPQDTFTRVGSEFAVIPRIFEENQVIIVETDTSTIFPLMEYGLYGIKDA